MLTNSPRSNTIRRGSLVNMNRYQEFGQLLKEYRQRQNETITDVANAVGIDRTHVSKIENGHERPSADVLLTFISHFSLDREEANKLWHEAGHKGLAHVATKGGKENTVMDKKNDNLPTVMQGDPQGVNVNIDRTRVPVSYSDSVFVTSNDVGVVLDFAQSVGPTPQQHVVSSIGMSKDQAKRMIRAMQDNLGIE